MDALIVKMRNDSDWSRSRKDFRGAVMTAERSADAALQLKRYVKSLQFQKIAWLDECHAQRKILVARIEAPMGTSSSNLGRSNLSQLIPSDVDANPDQPLPEPKGRRFQGFRTEFGNAISNTETIDFTSALGKYARNATGGSLDRTETFGFPPMFQVEI